LKGKQQSQQSRQSGQSAARQSCIHEWTFLGKIWSKNDQSFCNVHNVVLTEGMDGHRCTRLKGKQHSQQSAACQSCIQKWTFLGKIWSKNDVFLQYTQCSDSRETTHTCWHGKGFPGAAGVLEGVVMVMIKFLVEILCVHLGSSFDERHLSSKLLPR
jgi:hypothetical protein